MDDIKPISSRQLLDKSYQDIELVRLMYRGKLGVHPEGDAYVFTPYRLGSLCGLYEGDEIIFTETGEHRVVQYNF